MKKVACLLLLSTSALFCNYIHAQVSVTRSVDPISNDTILRTSQVKLQNNMRDIIGNPKIYISGARIDTIDALGFEIDLVNNSPGVINRGVRVIIKYTDSQLDTVYASSTAYPEAESSSAYATMWSVKFHCYLPARVKENMRNRKVAFVRVDNGTRIDRAVDPKFADAFKQVVDVMK